MHGAEPEWVAGPLLRVLFSVQRSQWRDWRSVGMNPCFRITKKYLHNLMNRCIEESKGTMVMPTQKLRQINVRGAPDQLTLVGPSTRLCTVIFLIKYFYGAVFRHRVFFAREVYKVVVKFVLVI
jgi:hypothetical protein